MSSSWPPISSGQIAISQSEELATLREQLQQLQASGCLDKASLLFALDYLSELGVSMNESLSLLLDFAEPDWLEDLSVER